MFLVWCILLNLDLAAMHPVIALIVRLLLYKS